jgi:hypothetical protein
MFKRAISHIACLTTESSLGDDAIDRAIATERLDISFAAGGAITDADMHAIIPRLNPEAAKG